MLWPTARLSAFTVVALRMVLPGVRGVRARVVGDPGDAYLILALLRWGGQRSVHFFDGFWQGPMFADNRHVMAYSDTFLPLAIPFRVLEEVLGTPAAAMNALFVLGWITCCEFTYLFLARLTSSRPAAVVGALAFTYSTVRLQQVGHFQLTFAGFIPLALLLLSDLFRRPSWWRGVLLGVTLATQFLISGYYGVVLIPVVLGLSIVWLVLDRRRDDVRQLLVGVLCTIVSTAVLLGPVAVQYSRAEAETGGRDWYPWFLRFHIGDLFGASPMSKHLADLGILDGSAQTRSSGNYAFVGSLVLVFVPIFLILVATSARLRELLQTSRREYTAVGLLAAVGLGIAAGRGRLLGLELPFYDIARTVLPGVRSMIAIGRLTLFLQFALVVVATSALAAALNAVRARPLRIAVAAVASALVLLESSIHVPSARVPVVADGDVYAVLENQAAGGAVAELPIVPPTEPLVQAYTEPSRMVLGSGDRHRTVNGHSGARPLEYEATADAINDFPSARSIDKLRELGVRYVVLHAAPLETGSQSVSEFVNRSGYAFYTPERIAEILTLLPPDLVAQRIDASDGVVIELKPAGS